MKSLDNQHPTPEIVKELAIFHRIKRPNERQMNLRMALRHLRFTK